MIIFLTYFSYGCTRVFRVLCVLCLEREHIGDRESVKEGRTTPLAPNLNTHIIEVISRNHTSQLCLYARAASNAGIEIIEFRLYSLVSESR
jgi:hypothetical protein